MTRTRRRIAALAAVAVPLGVGLLAASACGGNDGDDGGRAASDRRQEAVAERGAEVMPFDLEVTTHRFEPTGGGLVQTVVADDPSDAEQVQLVQDHLRQEADRFQGGDYADPARIHGEDMPGLVELEAGAQDVTITYEPLDDGARLTFTSDDAALVDALHRWGEAQTTDHGRHAQPPPAS